MAVASSWPYERSQSGDLNVIQTTLPYRIAVKPDVPMHHRSLSQSKDGRWNCRGIYVLDPKISFESYMTSGCRLPAKVIVAMAMAGVVVTRRKRLCHRGLLIVIGIW